MSHPLIQYSDKEPNIKGSTRIIVNQHMLHCYCESVSHCHWNLPQAYWYTVKPLEGGLEASPPALAQLQTNDFQLGIEQLDRRQDQGYADPA